MIVPNCLHDGCPGEEVLYAFSIGRLRAMEQEAVASHIEHCATCLATLEELNDPTDPLLADLRRSPPPDALLPNDATRPRWLDSGSSHVPGYEILGEVGRGGMGVVYKARQARLQRLVALKMILGGAHAGSQQRERFCIEAEAVAGVQHPNIVQIYEVGDQDGYAYLALEFLDGGSLAERIDGTPLAAEEAARLVETLARAMEHAHRRNIVHRDLKPANILFTADGVPKITDFGLAKQLDGEGVTMASGAIVGTPSYMSPEQAAGKAKEIGPATDVYALGAILYEMLTGRPPFKAQAPLETLQQVQTQEPVSPSRLQQRLPRDLATICLKCLEKAPAKRYASAEALAEDLHRFLAGEPIRARAVGGAERFWRWCRRKPAVAGLVIGVPLLMVAIAFVSTYAAVRLNMTVGQLNTALGEKEEAERQARLREDAANQEKERAEQALASEQKAKKRARQALEDLSSPFVLDWLSRQSDKLQSAHRAFLKQALTAYQEFTQEVGNSEEARAGVASAYLRVGRICETLGQMPEAQEAYENAIEAFKLLATEFPKVPQYRRDLAGSQTNLGVVLQHTGQPDKAAAVYLRASVVQKQLAAEFPKEARYRRELAVCLNNLGNLRQNTGQLGPAEEVYREALTIEERLATEFQGVPAYRRNLADAHNNLGNLFTRMDRPGDAEAEFRRALTIQERLAADFPREPTYRRRVGLALSNLGHLLDNTNRPKDAEAAYQRALAIQKLLANEFPNVPQDRSALANTLNKVGVLLARGGRREEAAAAFRDALAIQKSLAADFSTVIGYQNDVAGTMVNFADLLRCQGQFFQARELLERARPYHWAALKANPRNPTVQQFYRNNYVSLTMTLAGAGDNAAAIQAAEELSGLGLEAATDAYTAACALSLCIPIVRNDSKLNEAQRADQVKTYADRAMSMLRQAVAHGYRDVTRLKKDKSLDPLGQRDDFNKVIGELTPMAE